MECARREHTDTVIVCSQIRVNDIATFELVIESSKISTRHVRLEVYFFTQTICYTFGLWCGRNHLFNLLVSELYELEWFEVTVHTKIHIHIHKGIV